MKGRQPGVRSLLELCALAALALLRCADPIALLTKVALGDGTPQPPPWYRRVGRLLLIALVVAAVTAPMLPAQATFPGQNGRIAFRAS
jgi:hypothetical protein